MISVYQIKPAFQKLLSPLMKALHKAGINANQITIFAVLFSVLLGYFIYDSVNHSWFMLLAAFGMLFRMALNALDGMMARSFKMESKAGAVLNEIGDILSDLVIILPFIVYIQEKTWVIVLFALLMLINEYSGLLGQALGGKRRNDGPMGKSDRALLIGLVLLIGYFWQDIFNYLDWIFGIACLLILWSTFIRLKKSAL